MRRLECEAVPATLNAVHALLAELWADAPQVDEGERTRMAIAVGELVANVIEHGRTELGRPPRLAVTLDAEPDRLVADLVDDGIGYPPADVGLPEDELAERGRGLPLVHAALDEVHFVRRDERNHWHLVVHRA